MVRRVFWVSFFLLPLALLGCSLFGGGEEEVSNEGGTQASSLVTEEELVTHNVTYTGLLEEGGVTIYQEGSHRLMLSDGKMVILESAVDVSVPLALYVGKLVRVQGDVMPTVEAGGTLMKVREIAWIRREADADGKEVEVLRVICGGTAGITCPTGEVCLLEGEMGICVMEEKEETEEGEELEDEEEMGEQSSSEAGSEADSTDAMEEEEVEDPGSTMGSSAATSSSSSSAPEVTPGSTAGSAASSSSSSSSSSAASGSADAKVTVMAEEDSASERWTQQYCSTHLSFCIPVHKNWYYKSFGATTSTLWHVEVGPEPVDELGDGPLYIELKTGDLSSLGVADNAVTEVGGKVIGYRTWTENSHFEISAHPSLRDSASYITKGLRASE